MQYAQSLVTASHVGHDDPQSHQVVNSFQIKIVFLQFAHSCIKWPGVYGEIANLFSLRFFLRLVLFVPRIFYFQLSGRR